jgi:hypothetical protein
MPTIERHRSASVPLEAMVHVSWIAQRGCNFAEIARTLRVSRHGATIVLARELDPGQEITIRSVEVDKEATARIVGKTGMRPDGRVYGVIFLDPSVNMWSVEFPAPDEVEAPRPPVFLECGSCEVRAMVQLDEIQCEVLAACQAITLPCEKCDSPTIWTFASYDPSEKKDRPSAPESSPDVTPSTSNRRRHARITTTMMACLRRSVAASEVVRVKDASRGGFRFVSSKFYVEGSSFMVAMPYTRDASNVFVPAHVMWRRELPNVKKFEYGVAYHGNSEDQTGH